jgi:hypothetical protein
MSSAEVTKLSGKIVGSDLPTYSGLMILFGTFLIGEITPGFNVMG